jgi:hypothetical protein
MESVSVSGRRHRRGVVDASAVEDAGIEGAEECR